MKKIRTIGYVSSADPFHDRRAWSGTVYQLRKAIENAGYDVVWIPFRTDTLAQRILDILLRAYGKLSGKKWLRGAHYISIGKLSSKTINRDKLIQCDILFFPGGAQVLFETGIDKPYIYLSDATVHLMLDYYWHNIHPESQQMAKFLEEWASQHAVMNLRSSQWAANSVIKDCGVPPETCHVLEFGPNLDKKDIQPCEPYTGGELRILFSGVNWKRKGGDIAVEAVGELRLYGIDAHLTIAGIAEDKLPKGIASLDYVTCVGFLDKNKAEEYPEYVKIFHDSHILLLPTKAECAGIVFSEAASFGLPSYTHLTGGTGDYVVDGVNGRTLQLGATGKDFADAIKCDLRDGMLRQMREGALRLAHEKLSWEVWSEKFRVLCEALSST